MTFEFLKDNFKCPKCKSNLHKLTVVGHLYCTCNESYWHSFNKHIYIYLIENDNVHLDIKPNGKAYIVSNTHQPIYFDHIPTWLIEDNAMEMIETLMVFR